MTDWLYQTGWLGNSTLAWLIAAGGALLGYIVTHSVAAILAARLGALARRTRRRHIVIAAAVAAATRGWLLLLIAVAVALEFLQLGRTATNSHDAQHAVQLAVWSLVGIQFAFWVNALLVTWLRQSADQDRARPANPVMLGVLTWATQFIVWVTLLLALLAGGGVNITAFVASLGVGGVAVALALQNVLGDLFASISIGLDKPFEVGEFIAFGSDLGTVSKVGIKSTRIRSLSGEELAVANSILLKNLIHNYTRMQERRVVFGFRVPYGTSRRDLEAIVKGTRAAINAEKQARLDRGHFRAFGEHGFEFEFVYYVLDPGYTLYCDIQQRINLEIIGLLEDLGIDFAVPARMLHASSPTDVGALLSASSAN
ncbi:MAG TPA: mechanosensitive ion channel family protein [Rhodanobacteraceae bacterium]|nr:mechanosensitive ion channel family protein [Rhodanobacteraceae bacterium]